MEQIIVEVPVNKPDGTYIEGRLVIDGDFLFGFMLLIASLTGIRVLYKLIIGYI